MARGTGSSNPFPSTGESDELSLRVAVPDRWAPTERLIAVARPIPLPAPVMKATLPASLGTDHQDTYNDALGARADLARDPQRARRLINSGQPELMRLDGGSQPAYARQGARASGVGSEKYFETGGVGLLIYGAAQRRRRQ